MACHAMTSKSVTMEPTNVTRMRDVRTLWALMNASAILGFPAMVNCVETLTNAAMEVIFVARMPAV